MKTQYPPHKLLELRHERQLDNSLFYPIFASLGVRPWPPPRFRSTRSPGAAPHKPSARYKSSQKVPRGFLQLSLSDLPPGTRIIKAEPGVKLPDNAIPVAINNARMLRLQDNFEFSLLGYSNSSGPFSQKDPSGVSSPLIAGRERGFHWGNTSENDEISVNSPLHVDYREFYNGCANYLYASAAYTLPMSNKFEANSKGVLSKYTEAPRINEEVSNYENWTPFSEILGESGCHDEGIEQNLGASNDSYPITQEFQYNFKYTPFFEKYLPKNGERLDTYQADDTVLSVDSDSTCEIHILLPEPNVRIR